MSDLWRVGFVNVGGVRYNSSSWKSADKKVNSCYQNVIK
jgi:hypothetical protein